VCQLWQIYQQLDFHTYITFIYTYIYTYIHTYTLTHLHTYTLQVLQEERLSFSLIFLLLFFTFLLFFFCYFCWNALLLQADKGMNVTLKYCMEIKNSKKTKTVYFFIANQILIKLYLLLLLLLFVFVL